MNEDKKPFGFNPQHPHRFLPPTPSAEPSAGSGLDRQPAEVTITITESDTSQSIAYAYLREVVLCADLPRHERTRAAIAMLPFEVPKRAVSAGGPNKDFAKHLESARRRSIRRPLHVVPTPSADTDANPSADADAAE